MPPISRPTRVLSALLLVAAVFAPSQAAAETGTATDELPQALTLVAPFTCDTEWRGSTYGGHGTNNWNLDVNQAGDDHAADLGQPLLAQADGTVVWLKTAGYNNGAGTYIEIDYGDVTVRYIHLIEGSIPAALAEIGATVETGETIGLLGATGHVTGPHLHLEYWNSAGYEDTAWYQLPRDHQLPVVFDGQVMIAEPGRPTATAVSTNCPEPEFETQWREFQENRFSA